MQKRSQAEENLEHGKGTGVQHIGFRCEGMRNIGEGFEAVLERAVRMFCRNLLYCEGNVVKYYVLEEGERELAKAFLAKVRIAWYEVHGSRISVM